jgi:hypothetical protein
MLFILTIFNRNGTIFAHISSDHTVQRNEEFIEEIGNIVLHSEFNKVRNKRMLISNVEEDEISTGKRDRLSLIKNVEIMPVQEFVRITKKNL